MYRADIDGLRAVAVLGVLAFHFEIDVISGGFVGVDVFFVISGYLITRNILADCEAGRFSFRTFYVKRVMRLLPALIATLLATLLVGAVVMAPQDFALAAESAAWATVSLSNLHFALSSGYFEPASDVKPLLHTWSLSVEEQFYAVWPATMVVLWRLGGVRALAWFISLSAVAGLVLSEIWLSINAKHAYFLPHARAYQFMLGAACVWLAPRRLPGPGLEAAAFALGLALVIAPMALYDRQTPFPGLAALAPSLGAALLIWAGQASILTRLLANPAMVRIGVLSYALYLAHWPIVVFWRYLTGAPFTPAEQLAIAALSLVAGWALHVGVEQRFRHAAHGAAVHGAAGRAGAPVSLRPLRGVAAGATLTVGLGLALSYAGGAPQRMALAPERQAYSSDAAFQFLREHADGALSLGPGDAPRRVLILGDSTMQNYIPALLALDPLRDARVDIVTRGGCVMAAGLAVTAFGAMDDDCAALRDRALAPGGPRYDLAVWSQDWAGYTDRLFVQNAGGSRPLTGAGLARWRDALDHTLDILTAKAERVLLIGPQIRVNGAPALMTRIGPATDLDRIAAALPQMDVADDAPRAALARAMAGHVERHFEGRASFIDPARLICAEGGCVLHRDGRSLFLDELHFTAAATPLLAQGLDPVVASLLR